MDAPQALEAVAIRKIAWRILPLVFISYCIAYVDRANIAVAALTMNKDLGLSAFTYGLGAGIFFLGYFIFELPSNLILERVGGVRERHQAAAARRHAPRAAASAPRGLLPAGRLDDPAARRALFRAHRGPTPSAPRQRRAGAVAAALSRAGARGQASA